MNVPLLNKIPHEEFDYQTLLDTIQDYRLPEIQ